MRGTHAISRFLWFDRREKSLIVTECPVRGGEPLFPAIRRDLVHGNTARRGSAARLAPRLRACQLRVSRESSQIPSLKSAAKARGHFTPTQARTRPCSNEIRRSLNGRFRKVLTTRAQATPRVSLSHRRVARIQCLINICHLRSVSPHRHALHAWVPPSPRARCRKVFVTYLLDSYLRSEFLTHLRWTRGSWHRVRPVGNSSSHAMEHLTRTGSPRCTRAHSSCQPDATSVPGRRRHLPR